MNESFGYSILENKYAGNAIFVHEKIDFPNFHLKSGKIFSWNKKNIADKINNYLINFDEKNTSLKIREEFMKANPELVSWKQTVVRLINELYKI